MTDKIWGKEDLLLLRAAGPHRRQVHAVRRGDGIEGGSSESNWPQVHSSTSSTRSTLSSAETGSGLGSSVKETKKPQRFTLQGF